MLPTPHASETIPRVTAPLGNGLAARCHHQAGVTIATPQQRGPGRGDVHVPREVVGKHGDWGGGAGGRAEAVGRGGGGAGPQGWVTAHDGGAHCSVCFQNLLRDLHRRDIVQHTRHTSAAAPGSSGVGGFKGTGWSREERTLHSGGRRLLVWVRDLRGVPQARRQPCTPGALATAPYPLHAAWSTKCRWAASLNPLERARCRLLVPDLRALASPPPRSSAPPMTRRCPGNCGHGQGQPKKAPQ